MLEHDCFCQPLVSTIAMQQLLGSAPNANTLAISFRTSYVNGLPQGDNAVSVPEDDAQPQSGTREHGEAVPAPTRRPLGQPGAEGDISNSSVHRTGVAPIPGGAGLSGGGDAYLGCWIWWRVCKGFDSVGRMSIDIGICLGYLSMGLQDETTYSRTFS